MTSRSRWPRVLPLVVLAAALVGCGRSSSEPDGTSAWPSALTEVCGAEKDTFVLSGLPNNNYGISPQNRAGRAVGKVGEAVIYRGLLHFDLSALPRTPSSIRSTCA